MSVDLWVLGKPAKDCPKDWLVVPVKDAVKQENKKVAEIVREIRKWILKKEINGAWGTENCLSDSNLNEFDDQFLKLKKRVSE